MTSEKNIVWDLHNVSDDVQISADPEFLKTIFSVLCKNAVEAIGQQGQIKLTCESRLAGVRVIIEDNGPGIPPEHLQYLFSPYFSGRQAGRGLGFGLCKAWRLLGLMGGSIKAENRTPNGTRFVVKLRGQAENECKSG